MLMGGAKSFGIFGDSIEGAFFLVKTVKDADVMVTLKNYYRKRQHTIVDAEKRGMPVYVLRSNTTSQIDQFMLNLFNFAYGSCAGC